MGTSDLRIPDGWTTGEKDVIMYEWRCPYGVNCGKGHRLLYKKKKKGDAIKNGAWHLMDKEKHEDFDDFEVAKTVAEDGITENPQTWTVYYDKDGFERELPKPEQPKYPPPCNQKRRSDTVIGAQIHRRSKSRDKHIRRSRSRGRHSVELLPVRYGSQSSEALPIRPGTRPHEIIISRVELDEIIDSLNRSTSATEGIMAMLTNAHNHFERERNALQGTRSVIERMRPA